MPCVDSTGKQKIIRAADANNKLEGFSASERVKNDCLAMLDGKITADKLVERYVARYKK